MPAIRRCPVPSDPVELTKQIKAASDIVAVVGVVPHRQARRHDLQGPLPLPQRHPPLARHRPAAASATSAGRAAPTATSFAFVEHMEKVGFPEARAILADRAGIKLDEQQSPAGPPPHAAARSHAVGAGEVPALPARTTRSARRPASTSASRKLSGKTVRDFGLGFAPLAGDWLVRLAAERRHPDRRAGRGRADRRSRQEQRGHYDRFRDRVMFPIRDVRGQAIAFGGRIMPESPYAGRGAEVLQLRRDAAVLTRATCSTGSTWPGTPARRAGYLAVVEGYTDVMMAHQCGVPQVVATMGTALNARHVAQLRRYVPKVVLVYDADAGGLTGVDRALEMFVVAGRGTGRRDAARRARPVRLARPGRAESRRFKQVLADAEGRARLQARTGCSRSDPAADVETTRRIVDDVSAIMAAAPRCPAQPTQVKQELIVTRLAHRLGLAAGDGLGAAVASCEGPIAARRAQKARRGPGSAARQPRADDDARPHRGPKAGPAGAAEKQLVEMLARRSGPGAEGGGGNRSGRDRRTPACGGCSPSCTAVRPPARSPTWTGCASG